MTKTQAKEALRQFEDMMFRTVLEEMNKVSQLEQTRMAPSVSRVNVAQVVSRHQTMANLARVHEKWKQVQK